MPEGKYGPGGKWIHDRAHGIMEDGKTPKDVAYAVATQQAHKVGKSPKDFRTAEGVQEAKAKYDAPKNHYDKVAETRVYSLGQLVSKLASVAGQDMRTPMMNTSMPTDDSKTHAKSLLDKGQAAAELGPAPSIKQLAPQGPTLQESAVKMPSTKGSLPKLASDPLVQYLAKHAEILETNIDRSGARVARTEESNGGDLELASESPFTPVDVAKEMLKKQDADLAALFNNYSHEPLVR